MVLKEEEEDYHRGTEAQRDKEEEKEEALDWDYMD
jgi:hypothetical protein